MTTFTNTDRQNAMKIISMTAESGHLGCIDGYEAQLDRLGLEREKVRAYKLNDQGEYILDADGWEIRDGETPADERDLNELYNYTSKAHPAEVLAVEAYRALEAKFEGDGKRVMIWTGDTDRAVLRLIESGWNPGDVVEDRFLEGVPAVLVAGGF